MLEKTFQKKVLARLKTVPKSWVVKLNDATTIGLPDVLFCAAGNIFAIELKTKSKLSEIQFITLEKMERAGMQTFVATPENFEEIFAYIMAVATNHPHRFKKPARFPQWVLPVRLRGNPSIG